MKIKYVVYTILVLGVAYLIYHRISESKSETAKDNGPKKPAMLTGIVATPQNFENNLEIVLSGAYGKRSETFAIYGTPVNGNT
ncbi:MAG: hypothetical protein EOO01_26010, partial [Chitinophagaceae bacterium]